MRVDKYNGRSNLTAVVDAINQRYAFDYDPLGRVTGQTRAGTSMSYLYDDAGRRTQRTDYDNAVTNYTYDSLNRLTEIDYPDSTSATYGYDAMSRLTSAANQSGTVSFSYDALGRVSSTTDVWGKVLDYRYDANGNRIETKLDGTVKASYEYDDANRLTKITDGAGAIVGYGYDLANRLTSKQLPNGVGTVYQYDDMNRLTRITDATATAPVADSQYQYNTANQISQLIDQAGTHVNTYDGVNRLTTASHSGGSIYPESYGYDGGGNRTRSSYSNVYNYSPNNRLTSVPAYSGDAYENSFDNNGNTLTMWRGGDQGGVEFDFTWDAENRVKLVSLAGMSVTEEFSYDALGRRVKTAINSTDWTKYTYDGQDVILDQKSAGSNVEYLNGPGIDNKIRQTDSSTNQPLYFTQDHLGSTRALTDASGNVLGRANYDSFGYAYGGPGLSQFTRYLYTGREYDQNTALYYYRARWYEPQLGRFLSEDPIGLWGGINLYIYANGNPSFYVDPSGNDPVSAGALALGGFEIAGGAALTGAAAVAAYPFALYGAWNLGVWIAEQPWNPLTHPSAEPVADLCPSRPAPVPTPVIPPSPPPIDPSIRSWRKVRNEVLEGNPLCVWCGLPAERNGRPGHGDHIIPRSKGGSDELENAQPACQHCNTSRGNRDFPKTPPDDYTGPWPRPEWSQP